MLTTLVISFARSPFTAWFIRRAARLVLGRHYGLVSAVARSIRFDLTTLQGKKGTAK